MKVGDSVYFVSDPLTVGGGIACTIVALGKSGKSKTQIAIHSPQMLMLNVMSWDLLPANTYTQAILQVVYETFESIEREDGSILNLKPVFPSLGIGC